MVLNVDSFYAYLVLPNSYSCIAGPFFLINWPTPKPAKPKPKQNGPIHTEVKYIKNFLSSAAEYETYGVFSNEKWGIRNVTVPNFSPSLSTYHPN